MTSSEMDTMAASAADLALLTIESWPQAVIFIEARDLRILWLNPSAKACVPSFGTVVGGRVQLVQRRQQKALDDFLSRAGVAGESLVLDVSEGQEPLIFRCRAVQSTRHKVLTIFKTDKPSTYLPDVGSLFGLTRSESRIGQGLIDGLRADELAIALGVSIGTVRTHIRRIYLKTGVNSRERLIAKVSAFRTP